MRYGKKLNFYLYATCCKRKTIRSNCRFTVFWYAVIFAIRVKIWTHKMLKIKKKIKKMCLRIFDIVSKEQLTDEPSIFKKPKQTWTISIIKGNWKMTSPMHQERCNKNAHLSILDLVKKLFIRKLHTRQYSKAIYFSLCSEYKKLSNTMAFDFYKWKIP